MFHPATLLQFEQVKGRHPNAELTELPSGAGLVHLPGYQLPPGWSLEQVSIWFIIPVGYPGPFPDCFWTTSGLRLAGGVLPTNTQDPQQIPETQIMAHWFSWHIVDQATNWNPNRDDLETYVRVIDERFRQPK